MTPGRGEALTLANVTTILSGEGVCSGVIIQQSCSPVLLLRMVPCVQREYPGSCASAPWAILFRAHSKQEGPLLAKGGLTPIFQADPPRVRKHLDPTEEMHLFAQGNTVQEALTGSLWPQAHNNQMPRGQFKLGPARKQEGLKKPSSLLGPYHFF